MGDPLTIDHSPLTINHSPLTITCFLAREMKTRSHLLRLVELIVEIHGIARGQYVQFDLSIGKQVHELRLRFQETVGPGSYDDAFGGGCDQVGDVALAERMPFLAPPVILNMPVGIDDEIGGVGPAIDTHLPE